MTRDAKSNPLVGAPPAEIPLERAPLVRVLAQVRFADVLSVELAEFVAPLQAALSSQYGVLSREIGANISLQISAGMPNAVGFGQPQPITHWRFSDAPKDWQWRITLTSQFVSMEVARYTSRTEFFDRFEVVLELVSKHIQPRMRTRLGVRYVNRLSGEHLTNLAALVKPQIAGVFSTEMGQSVKFSASENLFELGAQKLHVRWAFLPPQSTIDPGLIDPIDESSFLLDLDVFDEVAEAFHAKKIASTGKEFAERSYSFFRWAVTDDFLRRFGGNP